MHHATIYIDPVGASPVGFAQAAGLPGDIRFNFKTQGNFAYPDIADLYPQVVLRPFTQPAIHAYDIVIDDPTGGSGLATIPRSVMNDRFSVEVYTRDALGNPQRMIAVGRIDLIGYAHRGFAERMPAPVIPVPPIVPIGAVNLDDTVIAEDAPIGTIVGGLSVSGLASGVVPVFTLVDNAAGRFGISGTQLVTAATPLPAPTYSIVVRATVDAVIVAETGFTITVTPTPVVPPSDDGAYTFFLHSLQY